MISGGVWRGDGGYMGREKAHRRGLDMKSKLRVEEKKPCRKNTNFVQNAEVCMKVNQSKDDTSSTMTSFSKKDSRNETKIGSSQNNGSSVQIELLQGKSGQIKRFLTPPPFTLLSLSHSNKAQTHPKKTPTILPQKHTTPMEKQITQRIFPL